MSERIVPLIALLCAVGFLPVLPAMGSSELVDPTRPPNVIPVENNRESTKAPWLLTAILVSQGRRIAVVNGQPVQAGEEVDGARVKHIDRTRVVLETPKGELDLPLVEARMKPTETNPQ